MINDDILIKYSLSQIKKGSQFKSNWVDYVRALKTQILNIKLGFPGISDSDLEILSDYHPNLSDRIILSDHLETYSTLDTAPILGLIKEVTSYSCILEIEGIGCGFDLIRDPDRNLRWRDSWEINLLDYPSILRLTTKPRTNGSSIYYYYNKHHRDSRW